MLEVQDKTDEISTERNNRSLWLILRFLALWLGSLVVLAAIGLLVDVNWTRPRVEAALGETLHRKIKLGHLRWHLGLNGLMVMTRSIKIDEMDGDPFLKAGGSNIGLSFLPLLSGQIIIKHLQMDHPEIYAVKLKPGGWNFEDLLDSKTTVSFMQIDSGTVHILDATGEAVTKETMDLNDVNCKFNWPRKGVKLPLFASCTMAEKGVEKKIDPTVKAVLKSAPLNKISPHKSSPAKIAQDKAAQEKAQARAFEPKPPVTPAAVVKAAFAPRPTATLELEGLSESTDQNLMDTQYDVNCKIKDMPTATLSRFLAIVADGDKVKRGFLPNAEIGTLKGYLKLDAKVRGSMSKGFAADLKADLSDVEITGPDLGQIKTKKVTGAGDITMRSDAINWNNILFKLGGLEVKTKGDLKNWQEQNSSYIVDMSAKPVDLTTVSNVLEFKSSGEEEDKLVRVFKTISMSGKAFFDLTLTGNRDQAKLMTQLEAEGLPVAKLVQDIAPELAPLLVVSGVSRNAVVRGHFHSSGGRRVSIEHGSITIPDSTIKLDGEVDLLRDSVDIKFALDDFPLKKAWENALKDEETRKKITKTLIDTNPHNIVVAGFVHGEGDIKRDKRGTTVSVNAKLHDGAISYNDNTLDTTNINGTVRYKDNVAYIENFRGDIGHGGKFTLSGKVFNLLTKAPYCFVDFAGTGVNFAHLGSVMNVFRLSFPAITEGHLTGTVKSLLIKISGSHDMPKVYFNAAPQDVAYQPPGLTRSLKAVSGNIIYDDDKISLKDVGIVSHGNRLTTNLSIFNLRTKAQLSNIHVKSDGIELGDIDYYLSSSVMPDSLRKSYRDLLKAYQITKLHGKIYGDLIVVPKPGDELADLEGVIGCYSVGATVSKLNLPLERIAGTFAASGNQLLIQDLSGYVRSTQFEMSGWVKDYKTANPRWKTELRANIAPNEFLDLVPALTQSFSKGKIKIASSGPMSLHSKVEGDNKRNEIVFSANADADDHLRITTPFGVLNQPRLQEFNLDGSLTLDQDSIRLHSTNLTLGDANLQAKGLWEFKNEDLPIDVTVLSTKPVPAKILLEFIKPGIDTKAVRGTIDGFVSLTGPLRHPILTGKVRMDHLTNPEFNLSDISGTISTDDKTDDDANKVIAEATGGPTNEDPDTAKPQIFQGSVARVELDSINLRKLALNNVGGWLQISPGDEITDSELPAPPILTLRGFTAKAAGGTIKVDGVVNLGKHTGTFNSYLSNIRTDEVVTKLMEAPGELTGTMDGEVHLASNGKDYKEILKNLDGTGSMVIKKGVVARFGQLQTKITQANLLEQGLFGFNFNNLLQSMVPVRTGQFNEVRSKYSIAKGILALKELRYSGDDLRLWGAGQINLPKDEMDLDIAGNIPRVTQSIVGGKFGNFSRNITVSKFLSRVTFGRLENLPALPLIGDIASDKPRTFSFKVDAPATDAKLITRTIEKSFKWLPNKQTASAHPVPGIK